MFPFINNLVKALLPLYKLNTTPDQFYTFSCNFQKNGYNGGMEKQALKKIGLVTLIYALFVFLGGVMGFAMKQSMPSLVMGSLFGLSLLYLSIKIMTFHRWGLMTAIVLILLLDAFFSYRFVITQTLFPAGVMLLLTTATLLILMFILKKLRPIAKSRKQI